MLISNEEKKDTGQKILTTHPVKRPQTLETDVVRFQNNKEKWIAFIGLIEGKPYEIFTGRADDEDGILIPRWVNNAKGHSYSPFHRLLQPARKERKLLWCWGSPEGFRDAFRRAGEGGLRWGGAGPAGRRYDVCPMASHCPARPP